jgi:hypothetical protein
VRAGKSKRIAPHTPRPARTVCGAGSCSFNASALWQLSLPLVT